MKFCCSGRLVDLINYLLIYLYELILLIFFFEWYEFVKLLISEDLIIIK